MAASTHWRIYIDANGGDPTYTAFVEIEMRSAYGGADLCTGGTASASSQLATYEASKAVDNSTSTGWTGNGTANTWWQYVFASPVDIVEVSITPYNTESDRAPKNFRLQRSDNAGSTWVDVFTEFNRTYTTATAFHGNLTCVISNAGGNWNAAATWVNGVVPTISDDVRATATSGNLTVNANASCRSLDLTGYVGTFSLASPYWMKVGEGSFILSAGMTLTATGSGFYLDAITDNGGAGWSVDFAGKTCGMDVSFRVVGGKYVLRSALSLTNTSTLSLSGGTLDTDGYAITCGSFSSTGTSTRALFLRSSVVTIPYTGTVWNCTNTGFTLDPGTSTIKFTYIASGDNIFAGGGLTYGNVEFLGSETVTITGANTFANLTRALVSNVDGDALKLGADQAITGTFTLTGRSTKYRVWLRSDAIGTPRTVTAGTVVASYADFTDITAAGAANWNLSATTGLSGDAGGNSGITFTSPLTMFWVGKAGAGLASDASMWTLGSGGTGGAARVPLPQDTLRIDGNSLTGGISIDLKRFGTLDATGAGTGALTNALSAGTYGCGSVIIGAGWTQSFTGNLTLIGRGNHVLQGINSSSVTVTMLAAGGTYTLGSDLTVGTLNVGAGGLIGNGYGATCKYLNSSYASGTSPRSISLGSGTWSFSLGWDFGTTAGLTFDAGTSKVIAKNTGAIANTFTTGGLTYYDFETGADAATGILTIGGGATFHSFKVYPGRSVKLPYSANITTITGDFIAEGTAAYPITLQSTSASFVATISKANGRVSCNYVTMTRLAATGGATFYAGANSTNVAGNTGWTWANAPVMYSETLAEVVTLADEASMPSLRETVAETVTLSEALTSRATAAPVLTENTGLTETLTSSIVRVPIGAHSYWRVYITANNGGATFVKIQTIEMRGVAGGANLCVGGTAIESSHWGNYPASNVFDGDTTKWIGQLPLPQWVGYHFAAPVDIQQYTIQKESGFYTSSDAPKDFQLQYSDDGVTWKDAGIPGVNQTDWSDSQGETRIYTAQDLGAETTPYSRTVNEPVTLTDTVTATTSVTRYFDNLADSLTVSDATAVVSSGSAFYDKTLAETLSLKEKLVGNYGYKVSELLILNNPPPVGNVAKLAYEFLMMSDPMAVNWKSTHNVRESFRVQDVVTPARGFLAAIEDYAQLMEDGTSTGLGVAVQELVTGYDAVTGAWIGTRSLAERLAFADAALAIRIFLDTLTDSPVLTDILAQPGMAATLREALAFHEALTGQWSGLRTISDVLNVLDTADNGQGVGLLLAETLEILDNPTVLFLLTCIASDVVTWADGVTDAYVADVYLENSLTVTADVDTEGILRNFLSDSVGITFTVTLNGDAFQCWSFSGEGFMSSIFTNYSFNSFVVMADGTAYGCREDGICLLDGADDAGQKIETGVWLNYDTFGTHHYKSLSVAFFGLVGQQPVLKVIDEGGECQYYVVNGYARMAQGIKSRTWELVLADIDALDFVELSPVILSR